MDIMSIMDPLFVNFGQGFIYCLMAFFAIWLVKTLADARTTTFNDDYEIEENSNKAVGFRRTGLYLAVGIALAGTLGSGSVSSFQNELAALLIDSLLIIACLLMGREICDRILLNSIDNDEAAKNGNTAVGLAECGMYIATGLILNGSFSGGGADVFTGMISALVFFGLGQFALCVFGIAYQCITPFNVVEEIKKNNAAAGLALAGMFIALGIILRASIAGPFMGWGVDIGSFAMCAIYGIALLLVFRKLIDWVLLPNTSLAIEVARDQNVAALALTNSAIIAIALVISAVI